MLNALRAGLPLDLKLGCRMLLKHPGMTVVAGLALAFALWVGAVAFELTTLFLKPVIPLPNGERIVQLRNWDAARSDAEPRVLHDVAVWRASLPSLEHLGVWRDVTRNLAIHGDDVRPVAVAETTADAFAVAAVPPLLGRALTQADARAGAAPVVVIGHDLWHAQFAGAADVLGRSVQLDGRHVTVVGVMPEQFAFPVAHEAWMPFPATAFDAAPREGVPVQVFARLTPSATLAQARTELEAVGQRMAGQHPDTHARLQPQIERYGRQFPGQPGDLMAMLSIQGFALLLLVLVACNVALLLFARTASREGELLVRSALGASRARISAQLVAEALVLGVVAAAIGLGAAWVALDAVAPRYLALNLGEVPFWMVPGLSSSTVLVVFALTLLAACIAGLLPALKVTRAFGIGSRLKGTSAGGGGLHFGGIWTAVIVLQVAVAVAFPATVFVEQREAMRIRAYEVGFPADEYLGVRLQRTAFAPAATTTPAQQGAEFAATLDAVRERLLAEPGVRGVALVDRAPRQFHPEWRMELDPATDDDAGTLSESARAALAEISVAHVDAQWFDLLDAPPVSGRGFHAGDFTPEARTAIVDEGFVERVLDGRNPVGMRIRRATPATAADDATPAPWLEIVGVVKSLGMEYVTHRHRAAGLYLPLQAAGAGGAWVVAHAPGDPLALLPRVREIAIGVDPALRVVEAMRLDQMADDLLWVLAVWMRVSLLLSGVALLLSLAGIYAVLSYTVARRTREIGVRVALGASGSRIAAAIFRRPLLQVGMGVALGSVLIGLATMALTEAALTPSQLALLAGHALLMLTVCLLACVVPTRRALRVQASEALRAE